jgi:hypothetical protein
MKLLTRCVTAGASCLSAHRPYSLLFIVLLLCSTSLTVDEVRACVVEGIYKIKPLQLDKPILPPRRMDDTDKKPSFHLLCSKHFRFRVVHIPALSAML